MSSCRLETGRVRPKAGLVATQQTLRSAAEFRASWLEGVTEPEAERSGHRRCTGVGPEESAGGSRAHFSPDKVDIRERRRRRPPVGRAGR